MNRLGWTIAALLVLGIIAFAGMARLGGPITIARGPGPVAEPAPAPAAAPVAIGGLVLPVAGVQPSALTDTWADPRGGGTRVHHAIDIMAPAGTAVLAAQDGRVEKLFESRLGGTTLYQRAANGGIEFYYAHLNSYAPGIVEGLPVKAGQVIGYVGSSGDADPGAPHLHFEIHMMAPGEGWWQGTAVDPYPLLAGKPAPG